MDREGPGYGIFIGLWMIYSHVYFTLQRLIAGNKTERLNIT